ncbi:MAG: helix-hairpin-helix domain-containing protein [Candidatus Daviesbacteria bacterium]|nr:helix-hairpin-helix domain-containing protein [Candidatus Daviesbacteria bacterium]
MEDESQLDSFLSRYKIPIAMGVVGGVLLLGGAFSSGIISKIFVKSSQSSTPAVKGVAQYSVKVDVSGAILNPGVYSLSGQDRVEEAIIAAGGITEDANYEYISKNLNMAQKVSDGMKIYLPFQDETGGATTPGSAEGGLININSASASSLDSLPGVGPATSLKIISKRPYGGIEELITKKVVSRAIYEKIKDQISTY